MIKEKLLKEIETAQKKLKLLEKYPTLHEYHGRWAVYLCGKEINPLATQVLFKNSCGCCSDCSIQAWISLKEDNNELYSDPPYFTIGERIDFDECKFYEYNIQKLMEKENFSAEVIQKILNFIQINKQKSEE